MQESDIEVLTIEEVAGLLRISRGAAYALARQWLDTNGEDGLPCIRLGRTMRVPRAGLARLLGGTTA